LDPTRQLVSRPHSWLLWLAPALRINNCRHPIECCDRTTECCGCTIVALPHDFWPRCRPALCLHHHATNGEASNHRKEQIVSLVSRIPHAAVSLYLSHFAAQTHCIPLYPTVSSYILRTYLINCIQLYLLYPAVSHRILFTASRPRKQNNWIGICDMPQIQSRGGLMNTPDAKGTACACCDCV